jgi:hypothetical protein
MVHKYPPTEEELRRHREFIPTSEFKFYQIIDALDDNWYVWHSVRWDEKKSAELGEADYLLFHPSLGFVVIEVKGGIISVQDDIFYSQNTKTYDITKLKDPFDQAETSMYHIRDFYIEKARLTRHPEKLLKNGKWFPLSFNYGVFFPDTRFKQGFESLQYRFPKIFDESDLIDQLEWLGSGKTGKSPLEHYLTNLLTPFKKFRVAKPDIAKFFPKMIGSNISHFLNLKKYYQVREQELEDVNQVQDFLINALSAKNRCIFKGSAGSGKTFIAMKKAIEQYKQNKFVLLLCFNSELRESMRKYISTQLGEPYDKIHEHLSVYSINLFLSTLNKAMPQGLLKGLTNMALSSFQYEPIAKVIESQKEQIPLNYLYDAIIVDEAQDIDVHLRKVLSYFLKDPKTSLFYVFYDEEQALFVENFSIEDFGMDKDRDLITLNRNLRNTVEIANWLRTKTSHGYYEGYSGINGFKITAHRYENAKEALIETLKEIKSKYLSQGINPEMITVLSYYKMKTLISNYETNDYCDYYTYSEKKGGRFEKTFLVEPKQIGEMNEIKCLEEIKCEWCITFKTISEFKGLESDIIFLILPNLEDFKQEYPDRYENYLMQIYVGASRAKFKLYFFEY